MIDPSLARGRVAVAMSGGVDSSVAALLLVEQGREAVGFFLKNGVMGGGAGAARSCCSASDAADARLVADHLGIPFYTLDVRTAFAGIIQGFIAEYRAGRTPNPCVRCNVEVKFGHLLDVARSIGAEQVATGHYARVEQRDRRVVLMRGADRTKDQSYVLSTLRQDQLARALFPLGELTKDEVRSIARRARLPVADKPESQEICFVPSGDYRDLVTQPGAAPGDVVTTGGEVVGRHDGVAGFTVGQRRGLGVALGSARHVVRLDPERNQVVIGAREEACAAALELGAVNWLREPPAGEVEVTAQIRHRHRPAPALLRPAGPDRIHVAFHRPEFAVTPGQTAALYAGDEVVAAGTIDRVLQEGS